MKNCFIAIVLLVLLVSCAPKKVAPALGPSVFDQICALESERHGQKDYGTEHTHFDNVHMDRYRAQPGSPEQLVAYLNQRADLCRASLLQLLCDTHPDYVQKHGLALDRQLSDQERVYFLRVLRRLNHPLLESLLLVHLDQPAEELRAAAVATLPHLDQTRLLSRLERLVREESSARILEELTLALDLKQHPGVAPLLAAMAQRGPSSLTRTVLTQWSTSDLADKRQLIAAYTTSADAETAAHAAFLIEALAKKDKLALVASVGGREDKPLEVDKDLQGELSIAIRMNDLQKIDELLAQGASLQGPDHWGVPVIYEAIDQNPATLAHCLEKAELPLVVNGQTPLMHMAQKSMSAPTENLERLLALGVKLDAVTDGGETALYFAAMSNRKDMIKFLLSKGANPNLRNEIGNRPLDIARTLGHDEIAALLEPVTKP